MRPSFLLPILLPAIAQAANIVLVNDDGWAEMNIRTLYNSLVSAGEDVILSAPAENESGSGSEDGTPSVVTHGCEFDSCPAGSPAIGYNGSNTHLNYVNSYPVTAMKYGVGNLSTTYFGGKPDIVVSGFNVGSNLGLTGLFSGTVGAASAAADQLSVPGIAFSGSTGTATSWNTTTPDYASIYADLAVNLTTTLLASGTPYLPSSTYLNVNFPKAGSGTSCTSASQFKFVLSRIFTATVFSSKDVVTCDNDARLPTESKVVDTDGCYISVSVGKASDKEDASAADQEVVLEKLSSILTCLP